MAELPPPPPPPVRPLAIATLLAFVGFLAVAAGWALPWIRDIDGPGMGSARSDVERMRDDARRKRAPASVVEALDRLAAKGPASGHDLARILRWSADHDEGVGARERRGWLAGLGFAQAAPWVAAALAVLLALGRLRAPSALVAGTSIGVALLLLAFLGVLFVGASDTARAGAAERPSAVGLGLWAVAAGSVLAFLGAVGGLRAKTWWKAIPLTLLLVGGAVAGVIAYVGPA